MPAVSRLRRRRPCDSGPAITVTPEACANVFRNSKVDWHSVIALRDETAAGWNSCLLKKRTLPRGAGSQYVSIVKMSGLNLIRTTSASVRRSLPFAGAIYTARPILVASPSLPMEQNPISDEAALYQRAKDSIIVEPAASNEFRYVRESASEYSEICLPNDANPLGNMLGGRVMHLVDLCGAIAGMRHSRSLLVTASIDQMTFLHPIRVGELVILKSQVNRVFRTSMEVGVKVWVETLQTGQTRHTSSAYLTFVALDNACNRLLLPQVRPETEEEVRRFEEAAQRRAYRLASKARTRT
jgi:acyl-CoA hydrolase